MFCCEPVLSPKFITQGLPGVQSPANKLVSVIVIGAHPFFWSTWKRPNLLLYGCAKTAEAQQEKTTRKVAQHRALCCPSCVSNILKAFIYRIQPLKPLQYASACIISLCNKRSVSINGTEARKVFTNSSRIGDVFWGWRKFNACAAVTVLLLI